MHDDIDIDPSLYVRSPILDVPGGIALGIALVTGYKAHAKHLPEQVGRAAKRLRKSVVDLQSGWDGKRNAALVSTEDARPADQRSDRAWAATSKRLEGLTLLPDGVEEAARAARLYARFFPSGLSFTQLPFPRQWAECQQRIQDLKKDDIEAELRELCGDVVVDELKAAHANYGRALGITNAKDVAPKAPKIAESLRSVQKAISDYAIQLVAAAKGDPEIEEIVVACLQPIDSLRAAEAARGGGSSAAGSTPPTPAVTPETPIPPLSDDS